MKAFENRVHDRRQQMKATEGNVENATGKRMELTAILEVEYLIFHNAS
jgi:hypothetical protein